MKIGARVAKVQKRNIADMIGPSYLVEEDRLESNSKDQKGIERLKR